jgi:hypothetical protein
MKSQVSNVKSQSGFRFQISKSSVPFVILGTARRCICAPRLRSSREFVPQRGVNASDDRAEIRYA